MTQAKEIPYMVLLSMITVMMAMMGQAFIVGIVLARWDGDFVAGAVALAAIVALHFITVPHSDYYESKVEIKTVD